MFGDSGTEEDVFTCDWGNEVVSTIVFGPRVLRYAQNTKVQGILIVPQWFSSPFWSLLFPNGVELVQLVKQFIELPRCKATFPWLIRM